VEEGEKLSRDILHSIGILISDINFRRAAFNEMLILTEGEAT
jgi:hypothetical protein